MDWCCIAAVNDRDVLAQNLAASPCFASDRDRLSTFEDQPSASIAYNSGLDATEAEIVVFAHQDVYLPEGFVRNLADWVARLDTQDPNWAVAGVSGAIDDTWRGGRHWSSGLNRALGERLEHPEPVEIIDEMIIIVKRSSGLRFDEKLPHFHMYGSDISLMARRQGHGVYVIDLPTVHNSVPVYSLRGGYNLAFSYMFRKWYRGRAIRTTVVPISPKGWLKLNWRTFRLSRLSGRGRHLRERASAPSRRDPADIATTLGYVTPSPATQ